MKKLSLSRLTPDPLAKAHAQAAGETITVSGYIRNTDEDTISICQNQASQSYVEYPRSSITAAFSEDDDSTKVTFLIASDAEVRTVKRSLAKDVAGEKECGCGCSDTGVQEARPLGSIHPALAAFAREVAKIKAEASKGSIDLKCAEARADCFRKGGTVAECDRDFDVCLFTGTFG